MKLYLKYDINTICKKTIQEQLNKLGLSFDILGIGEVDIKKNLTEEQNRELRNNLREYGIEVVENQKTALVQKIKDTIIEMVYTEDKLPLVKISSYLADKLNHSYGYLANVFSEVTYTSIENFIIMQKIECAKQLILLNEFTLTEIASKLNYSSVAHLSNQFKKTTGISPSAFQRIIQKRRNPNFASH